jgi:primosomal protein N' (replication factor Y)
VEEVGRIVGRDRVEPAPGDRPVLVGTERDLAGLPQVDLAVLVDLDGLAYGSNYRAAEEALRIGARLAGRVAGGSGRRLVVQTSDPGHPVVVALRRGDPISFLEGEAATRAELGYPPAGSLLVVEARRLDDVRAAGERLEEIAGAATVLGPAETREGVRWLVQGRDLDDVRRALRPVVQRWRDGGVTVRVDADPIDL